MNRYTCCVGGCDGDGPLHFFPNPKTRRDMFNVWVMKIRGEILINGYKETYIYRNRRVCHKHFEPHFIYGNNRLNPVAVPTLFLTGLRLPVRCTVESCVTSSNNAPSTSAVIQKEEPEEETEETFLSDPLLIEYQPSLKSTAETHTHSTPYLSTQKTEKELIIHLKLAQKRINVVKKKMMEFRNRLKLTSKLQKPEAFNVLTGKVSRAAKLIIDAIVIAESL